MCKYLKFKAYSLNYKTNIGLFVNKNFKEKHGACALIVAF